MEFRNRHIDDPEDGPKRDLIHHLLYEIERQAFLDGFYKATAYASGRCRLCPECPAEKIKDASLFDKKSCLNQKMARPAMEAAGIDVYKTVRQAGFEIHVVRDKKEPFTAFGLVLLE